MSGQVINEAQHLNQLNCVVYALKKIRLKQFSAIKQTLLKQIDNYSNVSLNSKFDEISDYIDDMHDGDCVMANNVDEDDDDDNDEVVNESLNDNQTDSQHFNIQTNYIQQILDSKRLI